MGRSPRRPHGASRRLPGLGIEVQRPLVFHLNLKSENISQANPKQPVCVEMGDSVESVFQLMKAENTGSVLVCDTDGALAGIFTERDALRLMASGADFSVKIEEAMSPDPVCISVTDNVQTAVTKMSIGGYRRLPVVDQGRRPVGFVKVSNILRYLVEHFPEQIYNLPPKPHHAMQHREGA